MTRCETCNGYGYVTEFRRFAGEATAGEPVDVVCRDCDGEGEWETEARCLCCESPLDERGWCDQCEEGLTETIGDPLKRKAA
jgi:RecJ-like exonuclease